MKKRRKVRDCRLFFLKQFMCISKRNIKWHVSEWVTCLMGNTFHFWMEFVLQILFIACHLSFSDSISLYFSHFIRTHSSNVILHLNPNEYIFFCFCLRGLIPWCRKDFSLNLSTAIWFYGLAAHCNNILMKGCRCAWNTFFLFVLRMCFFSRAAQEKKQPAKIMSAQRYIEKRYTSAKGSKQNGTLCEHNRAEKSIRDVTTTSLSLCLDEIYIDGNIKSTNTNDRARQKRHRW